MARVSSAPTHHDDGWLDAARDERPDGVTCPQSPEHRHPPNPSSRLSSRVLVGERIRLFATRHGALTPPLAGFTKRGVVIPRPAVGESPQARVADRVGAASTQRAMGFATVPVDEPC